MLPGALLHQDIEYRNLCIINKNYEDESGIGKVDSSLADAHEIHKMLKHTYFENDINLLFDQNLKEIESQVNFVYKEAKKHCWTQKKKMFVFIYYSGYGRYVFDRNKTPHV